MWNEIKNIINNLEAIEMGGPTILFQNSFLIYDILKSVDGINLKENNYWQDVGEKYNYFFGKGRKSNVQNIFSLGIKPLGRHKKVPRKCPKSIKTFIYT